VPNSKFIRISDNNALLFFIVQRTTKARNAGKSQAQIDAQVKASGKATTEKKCM
jgi:hypothetical protein